MGLATAVETALRKVKRHSERPIGVRWQTVEESTPSRLPGRENHGIGRWQRPPEFSIASGMLRATPERKEGKDGLASPRPQWRLSLRAADQDKELSIKDDLFAWTVKFQGGLRTFSQSCLFSCLVQK